MKKEVLSAVDFLVSIMRTRNLSQQQLDTFSKTLDERICEHFENHWFPEKPFKGSAYRCIRINPQNKLDPMLAKAAHAIGLSERDLFDIMPSELTLWIDPDEVSYRIGEEGSIGMLFENESSSSASSSCSSSGMSTSESSCDSTELMSANRSSEVRTPSPRSTPSPVAHTPSPVRGHSPYNTAPHPHPMDFFNACKDQLRFYLPPTSTTDVDMSNANFEYLSTFVAS